MGRYKKLYHMRIIRWNDDYTGFIVNIRGRGDEEVLIKDHHNNPGEAWLSAYKWNQDSLRGTNPNWSYKNRGTNTSLQVPRNKEGEKEKNKSSGRNIWRDRERPNFSVPKRKRERSTSEESRSKKQRSLSPAEESRRLSKKVDDFLKEARGSNEESRRGSNEESRRGSKEESRRGSKEESRRGSKEERDHFTNDEISSKYREFSDDELRRHLHDSKSSRRLGSPKPRKIEESRRPPKPRPAPLIVVDCWPKNKYTKTWEDK